MGKAMDMFELLWEVERADDKSDEEINRLIRLLKGARNNMYDPESPPIDATVADLYAGLLDAHTDNLHALLRKRESPCEVKP